jgi:biopolymer transport protein ExbD
MAALPVNDRPQHQPNRRTSRHKAPHMDFTPMVDLGFLLITFFMLTTTLAKPTVMPLIMPDDEGTFEPTKASKALTLLLGADNKVYWYEGMEVDKIDSSTFERDGIRQVLLHKMQKVEDQWGLQSYQDAKTGTEMTGSHLNVIIKPGTNSRYCNLVDALDEMAICRIRFYCIMDPNTEEMKHAPLK